jgi:uncharacterized protein Yka (UPF0111/DUF47 family)
MVNHSCQAADLLKDIMVNFNPTDMKDVAARMHTIEHDGDLERHAMMKRLLHEFITPIEREDIMALADAIDTVTDTIEDVVMRLYMYNIKSIYQYAIDLTDIIVKSCAALKDALLEFKNFKKSKTLHTLLIDVNDLEEEADRLYTKAMRNLYVNCKDVSEMIGWDQTFDYLEMCCDACEEVANVMEIIVMKNT